MRIKINLSANNAILPNNNQHLVNSYLHKCLGANNNYHDVHSNYSVSLLQNGILDKETKSVCINDAYIIVSSFDSNFISTLMCGLMNNRTFHKNIELSNIEFIPDEVMYSGYNHFRTLSPFLIRSDNRDIVVSDFDNLSEMSQFIQPIILNKLRIIDEKYKFNLDFTNFNISIDWCHSIRRFIKPDCRASNVNNCGFTLTCHKDISNLLYNIGIGQSTGAGFGCIYKAENKFLYRNEKMDCLRTKMHKNTHFLNEKHSQLIDNQ